MHILTKRGSQDNIVTYEHICDTIEDRQYIENKYITLGTVCIVLSGESGGMEIYMADSSKQWHDIMITGDNGEGSSGLELHVCTNEEINNGKPAVEFPLEGVLYLVPANNESGNLYDEYLYVNNDWELFGGASVNLAGYATESWVQQQGYLTSSTAIESIPLASTSTAGIIKLGAGLAPIVNMQDPNDESVGVVYADSSSIKTGTTAERFITPYMEHAAAFYGLAKAAGDTTQAQSSNAIGTYTTGAKTAIKNMLGITTEGNSPIESGAAAGSIQTKTYLDNYDNECIQTATGLGAMAIGLGTIASGEGAIAQGFDSQAHGDASNAEGNIAFAVGDFSHAEGDQTLTYGIASHAEGIGVKFFYEIKAHPTDYTYSFEDLDEAVQEGWVVSDENSEEIYVIQHRENNTIILIDGNHFNVGDTLAFYSNIAYGEASHTEGYYTAALSDYAHAEGKLTKVLPNVEAGHAEGYGTVADTPYLHVEGLFNAYDGHHDYIHVVGNGTDNDNRSNAYTLDLTGNAWYAGDITTNGSLTLHDQQGDVTLTASQLRSLLNLLEQ